MSTVVTEEGHTITVLLAGPPTARLFGLPFLLIGVYLLLQWLQGVADIVRGRATLGEMAFGTILLLLVTLMFLVPGWLLTLGRSTIVVDTAARTISTVRDLRLYQMRDTRALSEFDRVEIAYLSARASGASASQKEQYQVEFAGDGARALVALFDTSGDATMFGRRLADRVGLPVDDRRERERRAVVDDDERV